MRFKPFPPKANKRAEENRAILRNYDQIILRFILISIFSAILCSFFYFSLYDPSYFPQSCEGSSLSNWSKAEFYFLAVSIGLSLFDILIGLQSKKSLFFYSQISSFENQFWILVFLMVVAQFVLWIGLTVSYWEATADCGKLSALVYYLVFAITVAIGVFLIWFCLYLIFCGENDGGKLFNGLGSLFGGVLDLGYKSIFGR